MKQWNCKSMELEEKHGRKFHYNNATHKCTKCDKAFPSLEALKIHFLNKHTIWKKTASPEREIRDAESSTEKESTFRPKTTDCTDFDEDNLSSTVTENGNANTAGDLNNDKSIPANVQSSGTVASQPDTTPRSRQNISIVYECNICEKRFKTQHALDRHKTVQHTDKASLTCTKCNEQFNSFEPLKEHFLFKHTNWKKENREASPEREIRDAESSTEKESTFRPKTTDCTDFDEDNLSSTVTENENANTAGDLNNDKSILSNVQSSGTVASQPDTAPRSRQNISILYECNICEKRFKTQHAVDRHKTVQHTDKASLTCTKCNEQFNSFEPLKEHFLFKHTNWKKENREESSDDDVHIEGVTSENKNINLQSGDIPIQTHVSNTTDSLRDKCINITNVGCKASGLPKVKVLSNTTLSFGDHESGASLRDGLNTPETNDLRLKVKAKLDETIENFTKRFEEDSVKDFAPNAKKITNQDNESNGNLQNRHIVVSLSNANEKASDSKKITYYIVDTHSKESISNVKSNLLREALTANAVPLVTNTVLKTDSPSNYASGSQNTANMFGYMLSNIQRSTTNVANGKSDDRTLAISIANFKRSSRPVSNAVNLKPSVTNTSNPANTPSVKGKAVHVCSGSSSRGLSRDHLKTHTLAELYTCKACGKRFVGSLAFIRHCLTHNADTINYREKTKNNPPNPDNEVTDKVYSEAGITGHDGEMFDPLGGNVEMLDNCTQFDDYAVSLGDENSNSESSDEEPLDGEASKDLVAVALDEPCVELEEEYYGNNKPVDPFSEIKEYEHVPGPLVIKSEDIEENNISDELSIHDCLKDIPAKRKHQNLKEQFENIDNLEYLSAKRIKGVEKNLDNIGFVGQFSEVSIPLSSKVSEERNRTNSVPVPKILVDSLIIPTHEHNQNIDKGILEYLHEKRINGDEYNLNPIGSTVEDIDILLENKESIITENTTYNMPHPDVRTLNELVMDTVCTLKKEENVAEAALDTDIRDDKTSLALECLSSNRIPRVYLERLPEALLKKVKIVN